MPYDVRDEAMNDVLKAYKSSFALKRKGNIKKFKLSFRSRKKSHTESIVIHAKHYNGGVIYPTMFGKVPLRATDPLPQQLRHDARLLYNNRLGTFDLCVPKHPKKKKKPSGVRREKPSARSTARDVD